MDLKDSKLIILPGFSLKNKDWAYETASKLNEFAPQVSEWNHWKNGETEGNWIPKEIEKIEDLLIDGRVNILAKSIGTLIAMQVLKRNATKVNKLILCGIPVNDFDPGDGKNYEVLKDFDSEKLLVFQNIKDSHGSYNQVKKLLLDINSKINITSKERSDHEYPYWDEFKYFLDK